MTAIKISIRRMARDGLSEMWWFAVSLANDGIRIKPCSHKAYPMWPEHIENFDMDPADVPKSVIDEVRQAVVDSIRFEGCNGGVK